MLRKVIKKTHAILNALCLELHPTKTYVGKIQKGFNFLGYFFQPKMLLPSTESIRRFHERSRVRYAQVSKVRTHDVRDVSNYHVNERAPCDDDITNPLFALLCQIANDPDRVTLLHRYLQKWSRWFKAGLAECDDFISSVTEKLPCLALMWQNADLNTLFFNRIS